MSEIEASLRRRVKELLTNGDIDVFVGYTRRPIDDRIVPAFVNNVNVVDRLVWNPLCTISLAKYAMKVKGRVGLTLRGCDSRAVNVLLQESQVDRESLKLVGIRCQGVVDRRKIGHGVRESEWRDGSIILDGKSFRREEVLAGQCLECRYPEAISTDEIMGALVTGASSEAAYAKVSHISSMNTEDKRKFWDEHLSRCFRCDACKNICPVCYCERCALDDTVPAWVPKRTSLIDNRLYHAVRFMHVAGRCVDCGECERACPKRIPLRLIAKKLEEDADEMFSFQPGVDPEQTPMLSLYNDGDKAEFIK